MRRDSKITVATLEELRRSAPWWWLYCKDSQCLRRTPVALTPFIIRWGPDASSDLLRASARCAVCGGRGATLQHPSWGGCGIGWMPFPTQRLD
jgi:hypothetical protein